MKTAGIISEYHPFHRGHAYLCSQLRQRGFTHIVAIMSGNFVQRGECAVLDKMPRVHAALSGGADLVLELSLPYALATAETFAYGGVASLSALGCVDTLAFGSESGDSSVLMECARSLLAPQIKEVLSDYLAKGLTFASARQKSLQEVAGKSMADLLSSPNNTLGVEYCKQLLLQKSAMEPFSIPRSGSGHDSLTPEGSIASATYLRQFLREGQISRLANFVPGEALRLYLEAHRNGLLPVNQDAVELLILSRLRSMSLEDIAALPDISEGLEHRIFSAVRQASTLEQLFDLIKTKRYTLSRIRRIAYAALVGLTREDGKNPPPYLRILGMNSRGKGLLSRAKQTSVLPISTSLARLRETSPSAARFAQLESTADDLYNLCLPQRRPCGTDYTESAVII